MSCCVRPPRCLLVGRVVARTHAVAAVATPPPRLSTTTATTAAASCSTHDHDAHRARRLRMCLTLQRLLYDGSMRDLCAAAGALASSSRDDSVTDKLACLRALALLVARMHASLAQQQQQRDNNDDDGELSQPCALYEQLYAAVLWRLRATQCLHSHDGANSSSNSKSSSNSNSVERVRMAEADVLVALLCAMPATRREQHGNAALLRRFVRSLRVTATATANAPAASDDRDEAALVTHLAQHLLRTLRQHDESATQQQQQSPQQQEQQPQQQQRGMHCLTYATRRTSAAPSLAVSSALPWLLFVWHATTRHTHTQHTAADADADALYAFGSLASRLVAVAADALCAAPSSHVCSRHVVTQATTTATAAATATTMSSSSCRAHTPFAVHAEVLAREDDTDAAAPPTTRTTTTTRTHTHARDDDGGLLAPYWQRVVTSMLTRSADALDYGVVASARARSNASPAAVDAALSFAVGVQLSLRRALCAMARHHRLWLLFELHARVTGDYYNNNDNNVYNNDKDDNATRRDASQALRLAQRTTAWRARVLAGTLLPPHDQPYARASALLWRELVLFDAYTLITAGHTAERAIDGGAVVSATTTTTTNNEALSLVARVRVVQDACLAHWRALQRYDAQQQHVVQRTHNTKAKTTTATTLTPCVRAVLARLTPSVRRDVYARLEEALRLSAKVLLRVGASAAVCALAETCTALHSSWEVAAALLQRCQHSSKKSDNNKNNDDDELARCVATALRVCNTFVRTTRLQFATCVLPPPLAATLLDMAAVMAGEVCRRHVAAAALHSNSNSSNNSNSSDDTAHVRGAAEALCDVYATLRRYDWPVAPAQCFDAVLRGVLTTTTTTTTSTDTSSSFVLRVACTLLLRYVHAHSARDGLLLASLEQLLQQQQQQQQQQQHRVTHSSRLRMAHADDDESNTHRNAHGDKDEAQTTTLHAVLHTVVVLMHACPQLPIAHTAATHFARHVSHAGLVAVLHALFSRVTLSTTATAMMATHDGAVASVTRFSDAYVRATLRALSLPTLQALLRVAECDMQEGGDNDSDDDVCRAHACLLPRYTATPWCDVAAVQQLLREAAAMRARDDVARQPWRCHACCVWNHRHTHMCARCGTRDLAVVQCRACGGFTALHHRDRDCSRRRCRVHCAVCDEALPCDTIAAASSSTTTTTTTTTTPRTREAEVVHVQLRPWKCASCAHSNRAGNSFYCAVCGQPHAAAAAALRTTAYVCHRCHLPTPLGMLRPWCARCGELCAALAQRRAARRATTATSTTATRVDATTTTHDNDDDDAASSVCVSGTYWYCVQCHHMTPWLLAACARCRSTRPGSSSSSSHDDDDGDGDDDAVASPPLLCVRWQTRTCARCGACNALGSRVCRQCATALPPSPVVQRALARGMQRWLQRAQHASCPAATTAAATSATTKATTTACAHCGHMASPRPAGDDDDAAAAATTRRRLQHASCAHCCSVLPSWRVHRWVCLRRDCLHVNTVVVHATAAAEAAAACDDDVVCAATPCARCGQRRGATLRLAQLDDVAGHDADDTNDERSALTTALRLVGGSDGGTVVRAVWLSTATAAQSPRRCAACAAFLSCDNVAAMCARCGHCDPVVVVATTRSSACDDYDTCALAQRVLEELRLRMLLQHTHRQLQWHVATAAAADTLSSPPLPPARVWCAWQCLARALRAAPPHMLPWRGCDLAADAATQHAHVDVDDNDDDDAAVVHSSLQQVREMLQCVCDVVQRMQQEQQLVSATMYTSDAWRQQQRPWLCAALDLLDCVNDSTMCDRIGYDTLARLCTCIRPAQAAHIAHDTRWQYLRHAKLTRRDVVHDVVCAQCLCVHDGNAHCVT